MNKNYIRSGKSIAKKMILLLSVVLTFTQNLWGQTRKTQIDSSHLTARFPDSTALPGLGAVSYQESVKLFMRAESKIIRHRKESFKSRTWSDPITEYENWLRIFETNSPELLRNTDTYTIHLIGMLSDQTIKKDKNFNRDIIMVLSNLCIEHYLVVIDRLYKLYQKDATNFESLRLAIDQDITFSNKVAINYQNLRLRDVLNAVLADESLSTFKKGVELRKRLTDILSGKVWEEEVRNTSGTQPPVLKECR